MEIIAFCGLGEQFKRNVIHNNYICKKLKDYHIAGFIDQKNVVKGLILII